MSFTQALTSVLLGALVVRASPAPRLQSRQSITPLSTSTIDALTPYTNYASTGYCTPSTTINWSCGSNCEANPNFIPVASGGDGSSVQYWFVGYDPTLNEVIVSHQGTDASAM